MNELDLPLGGELPVLLSSNNIARGETIIIEEIQEDFGDDFGEDLGEEIQEDFGERPEEILEGGDY